MQKAYNPFHGFAYFHDNIILCSYMYWYLIMISQNTEIIVFCVGSLHVWTNLPIIFAIQGYFC